MKKQGTGHDTPGSDEHEGQPFRGEMNDLPEGQTDWEYLLSMTDEEARRNALADADSQPMTPEQLSRLRRAPSPRAIRERLKMTQEKFAREFQISVGTLRDWEQGLHLPDSAGTAYLRVIEQIPEAVKRALHASVPGRDVRVRYDIHPTMRLSDTATYVMASDPEVTWGAKVTTATVDMEATQETVERAA